eukprot:scaffold6437_cov47-Phaeocystis_antarctica.AAC.2
MAVDWTCGAVTVVLLPHARSLSERVGFIGGHRGCPDPAALARASGSPAWSKCRLPYPSSAPVPPRGASGGTG